MTTNGLVAALVVFILVSFGSTFHGIFTYHEPFLVFPARLLDAFIFIFPPELEWRLYIRRPLIHVAYDTI